MGETAVMTLTDFLLARIAEDEAAPRRLLAAHPHFEMLDFGPRQQERFERIEVAPARLLAECVAKRQIVELHTSPHDQLAAIAEEMGQPWEHLTDDSCVLTRAAYLHQQQTLRTLATPYADHPDYQQEWSL